MTPREGRWVMKGAVKGRWIWKGAVKGKWIWKGAVKGSQIWKGTLKGRRICKPFTPVEKEIGNKWGEGRVGCQGKNLFHYGSHTGLQ